MQFTLSLFRFILVQCLQRVLTRNTTPSLNRVTIPAPRLSITNTTHPRPSDPPPPPPLPPAPTWGSKMSIREISRKRITQLCEPSHETVLAAAVIYHRRFSFPHRPISHHPPPRRRVRDGRARPFFIRAVR